MLNFSKGNLLNLSQLRRLQRNSEVRSSPHVPLTPTCMISRPSVAKGKQRCVSRHAHVFVSVDIYFH